ncbi:hypothetical protein GBAR_LOCUS20774 [Geodia barretti]|uniref:Uncharacterized protein n=1 Tax=Geodia barretti TaxID=519541 RepID=A0AA35SY21_GEOBA|nr:hypothetical protein GBAR_LOCUS20774 [Geodia barretti]
MVHRGNTSHWWYTYTASFRPPRPFIFVLLPSSSTHCVSTVGSGSRKWRKLSRKMQKKSIPLTIQKPVSDGYTSYSRTRFLFL